MTVEVLINKILEKSEETGKDLNISAIMVRDDISKAGELTPEVDVNLDKAGDFFRAMQNSPETSKCFMGEKFEKLSCDEWLIEAKKELHKLNGGN